MGTTRGDVLRNRIIEIHNMVPDVLIGEQPAEDLWSLLDSWFEALTEEATMLSQALPGEGTVPRYLETLRESLRWEIEANRALFPAIQNRDPDQSTVHEVASILGLVTADLLDKLFRRLVILAELVGTLDGSIMLPEETITAYYEFLGAMIPEPSEGLDA